MDTPTTPTPPTSKFTTIGPGVYILRPSDIASAESGVNTDPNVILVFGWMGAKLPHLHKYTKVYEELYPGSTQILVRCEPSFFWSLESTRRKKLIPLVEALEALGCITTTKNRSSSSGSANGVSQQRILMHSFSNGGAVQMTILSDLLRSQGATSPAGQNNKRSSAIIIDSSPGSMSYSGALKAFTASLPPKSIMRIPLTLFLTLLYIYGYISHKLFRIKPLFERMQEALLSPTKFLPWVDASTPRLYVYSKTDEMVFWGDVERHVEDARGAGFDVKTDVYESSPHVAHARKEPERYWGKVKEIWESVVVSW